MKNRKYRNGDLFEMSYFTINHITDVVEQKTKLSEFSPKTSIEILARDSTFQ